jgi:hypothetical protein
VSAHGTAMACKAGPNSPGTGAEAERAMDARADIEHGTERVIAGKLHRVRRGHAKEFADVPPEPPPEPVLRPARVAVMLALAHKIETAIQRGVAHDRADVARRLGLTRARVTQMLDLTLLAPDIQEAVLRLESVDGIEPFGERSVRAIARSVSWSEQRIGWTRHPTLLTRP